MRKIATAAMAAALASLTALLGAGTASADPPRCPPGWNLASTEKDFNFDKEDRNRNHLVCIHGPGLSDFNAVTDDNLGPGKG